MINYGVLSTATIVPRFIKGVREAGGAEVIAIASRDLDKAKNKAQECNIKSYYGSYEELYKDPNIDVIYIPTVNFAHYQNVKDALNAGKHVVCEKPMTLNKSEAEELFKLAEEKKLFLVEAQKQSFLPVTEKVREIVQKELLGKVGMFDFATSFPNDLNDWEFDLERGGGVFFINSVYCIEYLEHVTGKSITEYSGMRITDEIQGGDKECILNFRIGNEYLATSRISGFVKQLNKLYVYAEKGYIEVDNFYKADSMKIHYYDKEKEDEYLEFPTNSEMKYEAAHFLQCIKSGKITSDVITKEMTIHACQIQEDIQNSWINKGDK